MELTSFPVKEDFTIYSVSKKLTSCFKSMTYALGLDQVIHQWQAIYRDLSKGFCFQTQGSRLTAIQAPHMVTSGPCWLPQLLHQGRRQNENWVYLSPCLSANLNHHSELTSQNKTLFLANYKEDEKIWWEK